MLRTLLRLLTRPLTFLLARGLGTMSSLRLGSHGVLEVRIDNRVKHPLVALRELEDAVLSPGVRGLLLHVGGLGWGWATLQEWREALLRMQSQNRLIVVSAESPGNGEMYLASAADRVVVPPMGEVTMVGMGGRLTFLGPALEKLGLQFDVEAAGAYKSFGETFTRAYASPENREAMEGLIDGLHQELIAGVSAGRRLSPDKVQELVDRAPLSADEAKAEKLIDLVGYDDALDELLEELLGEDVRRVPLSGIQWLSRNARRLDEFLSPDPVLAVVHLEGGVTMAREPSSRPRISPSEVLPVLRLLRDDDRFKGVVLAVNSPGGSVLASDLIWREVELLGREKPVVASFGDIAASGGYYISAPATAIVARPGTITGSIGVVGGKLVTGKATAQLGVFSEAIVRGRNVGMYSTEKPFDPHQRSRFKARLEETYKSFVEKVSAGRNRPYDAVEQVARGRVWTGTDAKERGLVDALGGLEAAITMVRSKAGLTGSEHFRRVDILVRPTRNVLLEILPGMSAQLPGPLGQLAERLEGLISPAAQALLDHPEQPLAVLPMELEIR